MRRLWLTVLFLVSTPSWGAVEIPVLAYHDITHKKNGDAFAVTLEQFQRQLAYLRDRDYTPVSIALLEDARRGRSRLPDKPVLLTFDDGLKSYGKLALPMLEKYGYPSVLSIVTGWLDGRNIPRDYRGRLMTWEEIRRIGRSPLVEILSHTDNLHHGLHSNPQGNKAPAVITREYDKNKRSYETEAHFRRRVRADLERTRQRFIDELGKPPVGITWPYGQYDQVLVEESRKLGMTYHLTLDSDPTTVETLPRINRITFFKNRRLSGLDAALNFREFKKEQIRFVTIDLDRFSGKSPREQERLLSAVLSRLQLLRVNAVLLSPFTRDLKRAFFHNPVIPVETDILNRVLHQVNSRGGIYRLYLRLPAHPRMKDWRSVYTDLARLNRFTGIILSGSADKTEIAAAREVFSYYRPNLKLGVGSGLGSALTADFRFSEIEAELSADAIENLALKELKTRKNTLFLLRRRPGMPDRQLTTAMRALRAAGAKHYGYDNDDYLADSPSVIQIISELLDHTISDSN